MIYWEDYKYKYQALLIIFTFFFFSYYFVTYFPANRIYVEGMMILTAAFILDKKGLLLLLLLITTSLLNSSIFNDLIWNMATISVVIYSSEKRLINTGELNNLVKGIVILLFVFVLVNEIIDFKIEIFKNGGPFPSSLHLSYLLISLSLIIFVSKIPAAHIFLFMLFSMSIFNGSRASFLFSASLLILSLIKLPNKLKIFYTLMSILIIWNFSIRAIGYESGNDGMRLYGFLNYLSRVDVANFLIGEGRANYGSIGMRANGVEMGMYATTKDVLITESSLIMLLYSHGIIFALVLLKPIFFNLYSLVKSSKRNFIPVLLMFILFLLVPFFDSPGIGVINAFLLNQMFLNINQTENDA